LHPSGDTVPAEGAPGAPELHADTWQRLKGRIAWAALYLASDESSGVTASEIRVDGGVTHW
jgi:NAD(P)-dependent dehydrogenase (short-subunit alcohol dehydrogenase family)